MELLLSIIFTLIVIFVVPVLIYGLFSALFGLKEPEKKLNFFIGVVIQKTGTVIGLYSGSFNRLTI